MDATAHDGRRMTQSYRNNQNMSTSCSNKQKHNTFQTYFKVEHQR